MNNSNELFNLIKSLTKSEKRYFKRFVKINQDGKLNNYIRLFEVLDKLTEYSQEELKKRLRGQKFLKHLKVLEDYLKKLILKSLTQFHSASKISYKLGFMLIETEILFSKKIFKECNKLVQKGKKLSYDYEKFSYTLEFLGWEKFLLRQNSLVAQKGSSEIILKEELEVLYKLKSIRELHSLHNKLVSIILTEGMESEELSKNTNISDLINKLNSYDFIKLNSFNAYTFYNLGLSLYYVETKEYLMSYKLCSSQLKIIESNLHRIEYDKTNMIITLLNLLDACYNLKYKEDALIVFRKFEEFLNNNKSKIHINHLKNYNIALLSNKIRLNTLEDNNNKNHYIIIELENNYSKITKDADDLYLIGLIFEIIVFYFNIQQYENVLKWYNKCIQSKFYKLFLSKYSITLLMVLISNYELKYFTQLDSLILFSYRYYYKSEKNTKYEIKIFQYLRKILYANENVINYELAKFKGELEELYKTDLNSHYILEKINIIAWFDRPISKK